MGKSPAGYLHLMKKDKRLTKKEAADAYARIAKELQFLQSAAAEHISRSDNNWVFEKRYSFEYVSERIRCAYEVGEYKGGGPHRPQGQGFAISLPPATPDNPVLFEGVPMRMDAFGRVPEAETSRMASVAVRLAQRIEWLDGRLNSPSLSPRQRQKLRKRRSDALAAYTGIDRVLYDSTDDSDFPDNQNPT